MPATLTRLILCLTLGLALSGIFASATPGEAQAQRARKATRTLQDGQSVNRLLRRMGIEGGERLQVAKALKGLIDLSRHARAGDTIRTSTDARGKLVELVYTSVKRGRFVVKRRGGRLSASRLKGGGDRPTDTLLAEDHRTPTWLRPHTRDAVSDAIRRHFEERDPKVRLESAGKLEEAHGFEGLRQALERSFTPPQKARGALKRQVTLPDGTLVTYALLVHDSYDKDKKTALHISLHGRGGSGPGTCRMRWQDPVPGLIIACPTSLGGLWYSGHGQGAVNGLYRQLLRDYNIDTDRVVVGGFSNGGNGTWQLGALTPWRWSALTPRSGAMLGRPKWRENMIHLPTFITHGTEDGAIGVSNARKMVELLTAAGNTPQYVEIQGGGHDFFNHLNPQIVAWMLEQKRSVRRSFLYNPTQNERAERVYWLHVHGSGTIEASVEALPAHTLVSIDTRWPPRVLEVHFPPGLIDPEKPVKVLLNGEEQFSGVAEASGWALLESFAQTGDIGRSTGRAIRIR